MKKIKKDLKKDYLVVYMDLSAMDKFKKNKNDSLTRTEFLKLLHESIIKSCEDSNIRTFDKKIQTYFKTRNFKLDKIESINNIPVPIRKSEEDYTKFASYVMDLPQHIYDNCKDNFFTNFRYFPCVNEGFKHYTTSHFPPNCSIVSFADAEKAFA